METRGGDFEPIELESVVDDVRQDLEHLLGEQGARVEVDGPLRGVQADASQIRQLLQNLVENAVKYSGDAPPRIHVSGTQAGAATVELEVADEGIGIAETDVEEIFRMSYQSDPEASGSGIGLAISRRIVARHGGSIEVDSEPPRGTIFTITLPAEGAEVSADPLA